MISSGKPSPVRVALVGYGLAGSVFHAPLIGSTPHMVLTAIVTGDPERAKKAAADNPSAKVVGTVDEILSNAGDFDLVVIASPNNTHYSIAHRSLEAGLAVVIDKPMATTYQECARLVNLAREKSLPLSVFQNRRWDGDFLTVKYLIESEQLGEITRFESRFERWRPVIRPGHWREAGGPEDAGGLLYDLGSHLIDQVTYLFGRPNSIYGEVDCRRTGALVDDDVFVALSFANHLHVHLWTSVIACSGGPRFQIFGSKGTYVKYGLDPQEDALRSGKIPNDSSWGSEQPESWGTLTTEEGGQKVVKVIETVRGDYPAFYAAMRDAIIHGASLPVNPEESAEVIRIIEQTRAFASARESEELIPSGL